jgi:hypothetical protein
MLSKLYWLSVKQPNGRQEWHFPVFDSKTSKGPFQLSPTQLSQPSTAAAALTMKVFLLVLLLAVGFARGQNQTMPVRWLSPTGGRISNVLLQRMLCVPMSSLSERC